MSAAGPPAMKRSTSTELVIENKRFHLDKTASPVLFMAENCVQLEDNKDFGRQIIEMNGRSEFEFDVDQRPGCSPPFFYSK